MFRPDHHIAAVHASALTHTSITSPISSPYYPVVLTGYDLPLMREVPIERIFIYAYHGNEFTPIPFQIDRRNKQGEFQIPTRSRDRINERKQPLDKNDECVFMSGDAGERMDRFPEDLEISSGTEIEITDPKSGQQRWVYVFVFQTSPPDRPGQDYVSYNSGNDTVESDTYRIAFSKKKPFLVDTLQWKNSETFQYSPDLADTMKVRHVGKFLHKFDFVRTQDDNSSKVLAVKDGPVRVIRKTVNRVRLLWQLRTPSIYIDYICYPNAFFMDIRIDIPFRIGWFFSDVKTLMTIDGNNDPSLPQFRIFTRSMREGLLVDGKMSESEQRLNRTGDTELVIGSPYGIILVTLDISKDFPIKQSVYLIDDLTRADPPEDLPGQFGNGGFITTGWEQLGNDIYHMMFRVYMIRDMQVDQGFEILNNSPSFVD